MKKMPSKDQRLKNKRLPIKVLKSINWQKFEENKKDIYDDEWSSNTEMDRVYRIYHYSFKMFYFGEDIVSRLVKILEVFDLYSFQSEEKFIENKLVELNLTKEEAEKDLEFRKNYNEYRREYFELKVNYIRKQLNKLGIKKSLKRQLKKLNKMFFTLKNNDNRFYDWDNGSMEMVGLYTIVKNISIAVFNVLEDMKNKKRWFWDDEQRIINSSEALVSSTFYCFDIRRSMDEDLMNEIRESIKKSLNKE